MANPGGDYRMETAGHAIYEIPKTTEKSSNSFRHLELPGKMKEDEGRVVRRLDIIILVFLGVCLVVSIVAVALSARTGDSTDAGTEVQPLAAPLQTNEIEELKAKIRAQEEQLNITAQKLDSIQSINVSQSRGGSVYSRWGKTACGRNASLIYHGMVGAPSNNVTGSGVNYQCFPQDPEYNLFHTGSSASYTSEIRGVEYRSYDYIPTFTSNRLAPCAKCHTNNRPALMTVPAKRTCPDGWTKEYEGYLMAGFWTNLHSTSFECVDANPQTLSASRTDELRARFYFVRITCTEFACPPYSADKELTCVVCSK